LQTALTFLAALGAIQVAALRNKFEGLAWPVGPRHKQPGYVLATLLMAFALLGGMLLVSPGAPLPPWLSVPILLAGIGLALLVTIAGAAIRLQWRQRHPRQPAHQGQPVELGPLQATFYQPEGQGPFPALCLLPDPTAPGDDLTELVQALVEHNIAVLAFEGRLLNDPDRLTLQGLVAVGVSHLAQWPEVDAGQVGLVGVGLGGDLALRSAAMDPGVAAALAIEPVLSTRRPGLGLESLHALSWFEAQRRARRWRHSTLVGELDGLAAIPCIVPRPVAIVVGCAGGATGVENLDILRGESGCPLISAAHTKVVNRATAWLTEHLA
jgi:hypothetical protein